MAQRPKLTSQKLKELPVRVASQSALNKLIAEVVELEEDKMPIKAMQESAERGPYDDIYTPYEALSHLLPFLPKGIIWESAPGTGRLVDRLKHEGHKVVWEDRDYFEWKPKKWDYMVTNPPFSIKARWLERANALGKPYAILLPVTALGARNCQLQLGGTDVLFLPRRIDFTGGKSPWFAVAWFTKGLGLPSQMVFVEDGETC